MYGTVEIGAQYRYGYRRALVFSHPAYICGAFSIFSRRAICSVLPIRRVVFCEFASSFILRRSLFAFVQLGPVVFSIPIDHCVNRICCACSLEITDRYFKRISLVADVMATSGAFRVISAVFPFPRSPKQGGASGAILRMGFS